MSETSTTTEFSLERSEKLASCITGMKFFFKNVDIPYAKAVIQRMCEDFNMYHSTAALNRNYNPKKADLIALQAESLKGIVTAIENLIKCDELKKGVNQEGELNEIEKMFNF